MKNEKLVIGLMVFCGILALYRSWQEWSQDLPFPPTPDRYLLTDEIPDDVRSRLHPWVAGFIGLSSDQARQRLQKRWESIERPSLWELRETLSKFEVQAIVDDHEGGMIAAYRPDARDPGTGDFFYLPAPLEPEVIKKRLEPSRLEHNEALREFLFYFGGLSEDDVTAGQFVHHDPPWPLFADSWDGSIDGFDEWENSLMLFHALNGCFVLVHEDGRVGWWVMQERLVRTEAENFDEFIRIFNEHRKLSWPFDPYGPPDYER